MSDHDCEYDSDGGGCRTCGKTVSERLMEDLEKQRLHLGPQAHGLMPRERRPYGFPVSRDWADVDCKATGCRFNRNENCMVPSRCKINTEGRCEGFETPPVQVSKPDGD